MDQQDETLAYFRSSASDWQSKAVDSTAYNVIEGRHRAVLAVLDTMSPGGRLLDVGCGTGQLVIEAARRGAHAEGIDFAAEMIAQCEDNAKEVGIVAAFTCASFFDVDLDEAAYDLISAQGFIEYLAPHETDLFFRRSAQLLRIGGALVVGSRNRVFNVVSCNEFTAMEVEMGTLLALAAEAIALESSETMSAGFAALRRHERIDAQPDRHPITGIQVATRYQYSPADLVYRIRSAGLTPASIFPVHFHGLPPSVAAERPGLHNEIANAVAEIGLRDHRLVPRVSSFVLEARRSS